jgi:nucleoside-diphosphate-sugar epimerase
MGRSQQTLFIFGLGYVGLHLAQQLSDKGWQIIATTRTPEKIKNDLGWQILPFTDTAPIDNLASHLARATHLISTIGPVAGQDPVIAAHKAQLQAFTGWTGYLSATSVYPDMPRWLGR